MELCIYPTINFLQCYSVYTILYRYLNDLDEQEVDP